MTITPRLAMPYLVASQAQKEVTHNDALNDLDFLSHLAVISRTLNAPPSNPATGDTYLIAASPTGAWAGYAGCLASYYAGWRIKTPVVGMQMWSQNENKLFVFDGASWQFCGSVGLNATFAWTPGTVAAGAGVTSASVTVAGAALGDFVMIAAPYDLAGGMAVGFVSAANTVGVRLQNGTAGSLSFAAGTWRVRVLKQ